jgi:hypothetical protein
MPKQKGKRGLRQQFLNDVDEERHSIYLANSAAPRYFRNLPQETVFELKQQENFGFRAMDILGLCLIVQGCLAFGVAGLFWPEKMRPLFDVLMFPWAASYRLVRANSIASLGLSILLLIRLVAISLN